MGGKMPASYWREYRKRKAAELREYNRERRKQPKVREQRRASEARRRASKRIEYEPLALLMPHIQRGAAVSFWDDELRLDVAQEMALAELEGRDPGAAAKAYRAREKAWFNLIVQPAEEVDERWQD